MITDKKFFFFFFIIIFFILIVVATFNYLVDYQNFFSNKNIAAKELKKISKKINLNTFNKINYSHRDIKKALALFSENSDCFVLGSSQHMLITSEDLFNLDTKCIKNTNLSLPGGSLEDILINTYFTSIREKKIKKVFLGIGPYTFKYNSDYQLRWKNFENIFNKMNDKNIFEEKNIYQQSIEILKVLYNKKFFIKNLNYIKNKILYSNGLDKDLNLEELKINYDGSYILTGNYASKKGESIKEVENARWGFNELNFDKEPKNSLINNIKFIQSKGIEVDIILIPFHPIVFSSKDWIVEYILTADNEIKKISEELNLKIHGSFFPDDLDCSKFDFYDDSHPKKSCIKNITR